MDSTGFELLLTDEMKREFGRDEKRIRHALSVLDHAKCLLAAEGGDAHVVLAAAILHDIGIQEAERKHGSSSGRYQEIEGPPIAGRILQKAGMDESRINHVCKIVGSHHSAKDIDTPEFRILWDADWLVNIPDEHPDLSPEKIKRLIDKVFRTKAGRERAEETFLGR